MTTTLHRHIRGWVLIVWLIAWVAWGQLVFWLIGGFQTPPNSSAFLLASAAPVATAIFSALIACSARIQALVLRPGGDIRAIRFQLWFIVLITGVLGVGTIVAVIIGERAHA